VFLIGAGVALGSIAMRATEGDWRTQTLVAGLGLSLLLGGLALNGWMLRLCVALAWIFPVTLLFCAVVLLIDPELPRVR
jgi:hypothetical protein